MTTSRLHRAVAVAVASALGLLLRASPARAVDRRVEAAAKKALQQAATDYLALTFDAAAARLQRALRACGTSRCTTTTRAALLRDLGTMQFRTGDVGRARATWAQALKLAPDLALNPDYQSADLAAAFDAARGGSSQTPSRAAPAEDLAHTPPDGQRPGLPLPVYVEYTGSTRLARVLLKYRGPKMAEWGHVDLEATGRGWGGVIPCAAVTRGTVRYWVQGFDADSDPVASARDPGHPFTVEITEDFAGEAPHLPGRAAPTRCGEAAPPAATAAEEGETEAPEERHAPAALPGAYARWWIGVSGMLDFVALPGGQNVCTRTSSGQPGTAAGFTCTSPSGQDFPFTAAQNAELSAAGHAGTVPGGVQPGDVRVLVSLDYALSPSVLLGARGGYVLNSYPGSVAVSEGRAFGSKLDLEARLTWLLGPAPLASIGFAPVLFAGGGVAEVDGAQATSALTTTWEPVNAWITSGPFFVEAGAGVRYAFSLRWGLSLAARLNAAFGASFLATYGPEVGVAYGF